MNTYRLVPLLGAALLLVIAGCSNSRTMSTNMEGPGPMNTTAEIDLSGTASSNSIVENAMAIEDLSMLVNALQQADLVGALSGPGPFTVFAPTNAAFARADVDMDNLENVLLYHVAEGEMMSGQLTDGMTLSMMGGEEAMVSVDGMTYNIDGADVLYPNIESSNGVIHIINLVLNPTEGGHIDTD